MTIDAVLPSRTFNPDEFDPYQIKQSEFSALRDKAYLDVASRAPLATSVRSAIDRYVTMRSVGGDKDAMFETTERVRAKVSRLIGAAAEEIAYTKNVSEGLSIVATSLNLNRGDEVVFCPEAEHPNNIYLWLHLQNTIGIKLVAVRAKNGCIDSDAIAEAIGPNTRLVTVSAATFAPGARTDLKTIGQRCRATGAFFLVDGAQAVGTLDLNVCRDFIDGLAFSTQKGLLGLYGLGFLYCRSSWAEQMSPRSVARFSVDVSGHEADFASEYKLRRSALRFDLGNYNFLAATAVEPSLDLLLRIGTPAIDQYLSSLSSSLIDGLIENDIPVVGGRGKAICNIVTAGTPAAANGSIAGERYTSIMQALVEAGIVLSSRRGLLRFSFHVYNTKADVERVLHTVEMGDTK